MRLSVRISPAVPSVPPTIAIARPSRSFVEGVRNGIIQAMSADPILDRAKERRKRIEVNKASSFAEAECWDLDFWLARTPEERLDACLRVVECGMIQASSEVIS